VVTIINQNQRLRVPEKTLYEPVRKSLEQKFRKKFGNCYLEVTSNGFSEKIKSAFPFCYVKNQFVS